MREMLLICMILLVALPSLAEPIPMDYKPDPLTPIPAGQDVITSVKKGEPVPYDGQLMDAATALRWTNFLLQSKYRLSADVLSERKECNIRLEYDEKRLALFKETSAKIEKDLTVRVLDLEKRNMDLQIVKEPSIFASPVLWFVVGMAVSGVGIGVVIAAVK